MLVRELRKRPNNWAEHALTIRRRWALPLHALEWTFDWTAYYLSHWAFLEVLEYLGILSVLVAVIFYFTESGDRIKQKHYQAWQVINTAQGKGGSGGRIEALQELNLDRVPLVGVDVSGAFLQGLQLDGADLHRANLEAADIRDCGFHAASLEFASLKSANLRHGDLRKTDLRYADLEEADLTGASLEGADLTGADLTGADLRNTGWKDARWEQIKAIGGANIHGIRNAPRDFVDWALAHGAVSLRQDDE
jgi:hypothetical protein